MADHDLKEHDKYVQHLQEMLCRKENLIQEKNTRIRQLQEKVDLLEQHRASDRTLIENLGKMLRECDKRHPSLRNTVLKEFHIKGVTHE